MNKEQALDIIKQIAENYKGTLAEHQTIQTAINTNDNAIKIYADGAWRTLTTW